MFKKKKNLFAVLAVVAAIALTGAVALAVYTNQAYKKAVVQNNVNEEIRFSSDYLSQIAFDAATGFAVSNIYFSKDTESTDETVSFEVNIYNHPLRSKDKYNERDITYTLTAVLGSTSNGGSYSIEEEGVTTIFSNSSVTLPDRYLQGRKESVNTYRITMPREDIGKATITITAKPVNDCLAATNSKQLAAVIVPQYEVAAEAFSVTGSFPDALDNHPVGDYGGINYEVSVNGGKADVTLKWKPDIVEIDPFFLQKLGKAGTYAYDKEKGTLAFAMESGTASEDYLIPFYIVNLSELSKYNWSTMDTVISVTGTKVEQQTR